MSLRSYLSFSVLAALLLTGFEGLRTSSAQGAEKPSKPLTGYKVINVEKFAVGAFSTKEGFPPDFAQVMQKLAVEKLTASKLFEKVTDISEASAARHPMLLCQERRWDTESFCPQPSSGTTPAAELSDG